MSYQNSPSNNQNIICGTHWWMDWDRAILFHWLFIRPYTFQHFLLSLVRVGDGPSTFVSFSITSLIIKPFDLMHQKQEPSKW